MWGEGIGKGTWIGRGGTTTEIGETGTGVTGTGVTGIGIETTWGIPVETRDHYPGRRILRIITAINTIRITTNLLTRPDGDTLLGKEVAMTPTEVTMTVS